MKTAIYFVSSLRALSLGQRLAVIQAIFSALATAAAYAVLLKSAGAASVGLLAVSQSYYAFFKIVDPLSSSGLGRFVAIALNRKDAEHLRVGDSSRNAPSTAISYIDSHFVGAALVGIVLLVPAVFCVDMFPPLANELMGVSPGALVLAIGLASVLNSLATGTCDALDGSGYVERRCLLQLIGTAVFVFAALIAVEPYGLFGFVSAQAAQWIVITVLGRRCLVESLDGLRLTPRTSRLVDIVNLSRYGMKLQLSNVLTVACEPLLKILLSFAGSLNTVGVVEISLRLITAVRGLVVSAFMPKVPSFAVAAHQVSNYEVVAMLRESNRTLGVLCFGFFMTMAVSGLIFGYFQYGDSKTSVLLFGALALGYIINTIGVTAYLFGQAAGEFRWNYVSQGLVPATMSLFWFCVAGPIRPDTAIVVGYCLGLCLSGAAVNFGTAHRLGVRPRDLWIAPR